MANDESNNVFSQELLDALELAIAGGVLHVKYQDREITYRSMPEMLQARNLMRKKLGYSTSGNGSGLFGGTRITASHSKGLDE